MGLGVLRLLGDLLGVGDRAGFDFDRLFDRLFDLLGGTLDARFFSQAPIFGCFPAFRFLAGLNWSALWPLAPYRSRCR